MTFTNEQVTPHIKRILGNADVCMYLVEGATGALLIDTGYGIGDLKGYVDAIVQTPYEVLLTHGHIDHAAGAAQFERAWLDAHDFELYEHHCSLEARRSMLGTMNPEFMVQTQDDRFIEVDASVLVPLPADHVFDLGDVHVSILSAPGHTTGTVVPLVGEDRAVIFGDACGVGTLLNLAESAPVSTFLASMENLAAQEDAWDTVLREHGTFCSTKGVLADNIELARRILAGTDDAVESVQHGATCWRAAAADPETGQRLDGREGNIFYDRAKIA